MIRKFKLDGLLKVRHFREEGLKVELGNLNREILKVKNKINKLEREIDEGYREHERLLRIPSDGQIIKFFPYFIELKKEEIKTHENILYSLLKKREEKANEVNKAVGESKIIVNMKDKFKIQLRKERERKNQDEIEDILMMRRSFKEGNV